MDTDMGGWKDLLHSSTKLLEQAAPSSQFPPIQRSLDQLEAMSKKLKAKTLRTETPSQSIAATRLLAREGINAEQLARDLKSFELKTTFEDVFPAEATTVEEYLKQVHEMAMVSAIQEAQKDNLKSFNAYMMKKAEDDWKKEKGDFLQSLSRLSTLPRTDSGALVSGSVQPGPTPTLISRSKVSNVPSGVNVTSLTNTPVLEKKATVYGEVVRSLNDARERSLPFKPAASFSAAYDGLALETAGKKSVGIRTMWHLIQSLVGENISTLPNVSKKMLLVIGSRHHLEWGHEKFIMDTIQSHPAQAALGGAVGNLHKIQAFLRVRLRDHGVLDFDAGDARRQPPIDTTWQQIYFCLRTGYYNEARSIAQSSHVARQFASLLAEWITSGGMVSRVSAAAAAEECEKMLRIGDHAGRAASDRKKLLLYAIVSGCRRLIDRLLRDIPSMFSNIEDFLWFKLAAIRDYSEGASSTVLAADWVPYTLHDLQTYLNKFEPSYYTKNGKDPLFYPYVLLLSTQLLPAIVHLSKEIGEEGYHIDAVHMAVALADHGVISESTTSAAQTLGSMDSFADVSSIIRQYGSAYLRQGNLSMAMEYFAQAGAAVGGGKLSWSGNVSVENQRRRDLMLKQLLTDILLSDGGVALLLGSRGAGKGGALRRFITDEKARQKFLMEAARQSQEAGLYDKSIEIQKRIGAYGMALETINKCLSDAVCALLRGRSDSESLAAGFIHSGNEIVESYKYSSDSSLHDKQFVSEQLTLRQLEAILFVSKLARSGHYTDALREIVKLQFLPLDPRSSEVTSSLDNLSPHVQACVPDLLNLALNCLDQMTDSDGSVRAMKNKITRFVAAHRARNWPQDLYEKVAQNL